MIHITDKNKCCGCSACVQVCPKQCIKMIPDEEGFDYPSVDLESCVNCGLCEKVCPILNENEERLPIKTFAAKNRNNSIRNLSSSGGVFSLIAQNIIEDGGVVFGARFSDSWEVIHECAETVDDILNFRGAKYVQSHIGTVYRQTEQILKSGRKVLFSGTPCQIAGLYNFLAKHYDNLFTVDVVCHGVPSPMIWKDYLAWVCSAKNISISDLDSILFRSKETGWRNYSIKIFSSNIGKVIFEKHHKNLFIKGFLSNLTIRPSCYYCPFKRGKSLSDLTLGDFWGVEYVNSSFADDEGVSLININTHKGECLLNSVSLDLVQAEYEDALKYNPCISTSVDSPKERGNFWNVYKNGGIESMNKYFRSCEDNLLVRGIKKIGKILKLFI